jgi:hypothetical protein
MYKIVAAVAASAVLAALAIGGVAQSSVAGAQYSEPDRLFGGGRFEFDFDLGPNELILPREFSLQAESRNGRSGLGTRIYGNPDQQEQATPNVISCLNAESGRAVIGGLDPVGTPYVQYFDDRSTAGKAPSDGITPVLNMSRAEVESLMRKQFPDVCPSTSPPAEWGHFWTTLESGDVAVVDR